MYLFFSSWKWKSVTNLETTNPNFSTSSALSTGIEGCLIGCLPRDEVEGLEGEMEVSFKDGSIEFESKEGSTLGEIESN